MTEPVKIPCSLIKKGTPNLEANMPIDSAHKIFLLQVYGIFYLAAHSQD